MDSRFSWEKSLDAKKMLGDGAFKKVFSSFAAKVVAFQKNAEKWKTSLTPEQLLAKETEISTIASSISKDYAMSELCFTNLAAERIGNTDQAVAARCCYDTLLNTYIGSVGVTKPASQYTVVKFEENIINLQARVSAQFANDSSFFSDACLSNNLCDRYLNYRPVPDCQKYVTPKQGNAFGDPHVGTIDGLGYTFNGLGDYYLLTSNLTNGAGIQSRTCKAFTLIPPSQATVFCAFAIYEKDEPTVEIYKNTTTKAVTFLVAGQEYDVAQFVDGASISQQKNVMISYEKVDNSTSKVKIVMPSTLSLTATINERMLQPVVAAPDNLKGLARGLMGNNNGNPDDDLRAHDGTVLSRNSTEKEIYYNFGVTWSVASSDIKFTTPFNEDKNFIPFFYTSITDLFNGNQTLIDNALKVCGGEYPSCLFDFKVTADAAAAKSGVAAVNEFQADKELLARVPPEIHGPKVISVTVGKSHQFTVNATSNSSTSLKYSVNSSNAQVLNLNMNTGQFELKVTQLNTSVVIEVSDEQGNKAQLTVVVHICACENKGNCSNVINSASEHRNAHLEVYQCKCPLAWDGSLCTEKVDLCKKQPCFTGVSCTNVYEEPARAQCGKCPMLFSQI
jgi:hypothetical protein